MTINFTQPLKGITLLIITKKYFVYQFDISMFR